MEMTDHRSTSGASSKLSVPFYAPPPSVKKTSAEIISEARDSILREPVRQGNPNSRMFASIRTVDTKRPFTPRERQRTLFGTSRKTNARPPSTFSLGYLNNQDDPSTPPSPNVRRLHPLPHPSSYNARYTSRWKTLFEDQNLESVEENAMRRKKRRTQSAEFLSSSAYLTSVVNKMKLPSISRQRFKATASLDNLPEEIESDDESQRSYMTSVLKEPPPIRKTRSSPIQRTRSIDSEMALLANCSESPRRVSAVINDHISNTDHKINDNKAIESPPDSNKIIVNSTKINDPFNLLNKTRNETESNKLDVSFGEKVPSHNSRDRIDGLDSAVDIFDVDKWRTEMAENKMVDYLEMKRKEEIENTLLSLNGGKDHLSSHAEQPTITRQLSKDFQNIVKYETEVKENRLNESKLTKPSNKHDNRNIVDLLKERKDDLRLEEDRSSKTIEKKTKTVENVVKRRSTKETGSVLQGLKTASGLKQEEIVGEKTTTGVETEECVQTILATLNILADIEAKDSEVMSHVSKLYKSLESEQVIGTNVKNSKVKTQVLKCLYKFIERTDDNLLLEIARVILAFRVRSSNLSGVCKLVFKVSRNDKNDKLFLEDNILELFIDSLGSASPLEDAEACVYGYGALKFLTMNNVLLTRVLNLGTLELMVLHMKIINTARSDGSLIPEQTSHALFQLTGALRNVAGEEEMFPQFVTSGSIVELCRAMELFSSDLDVISNVSRTISIISTHDQCCSAIVDYENVFRVFVKLFGKYPGRQDIVVRLGYALGNLVAKSDTARTKFYEEDGSIDSLLNLLTIYLDKDLKLLESNETTNDMPYSDSGSNGSIEDVIVKMIRIIANMSINPVIGSTLACSFKSIYVRNNVQSSAVDDSEETAADKNGGRFLDVLLAVLHRKSVAESNELIHSVLSTLNNLSYYPTNSVGPFGQRQMEIAQALGQLLDAEDKDCLIETTRVFGNLTRSKDTRDYIVESGGFTKLVSFLYRDDIELLSTTAGILVNMMSDWDKRVALQKQSGIERLIHVLKHFGESNWELATLVCQALWNYCIETFDIHAAFGLDDTNTLLSILIDCLDEERLFGVEEGAEVPEEIASSLDYQLWDEFAGVATNLMEKIETYLDSQDMQQ